MRPEAGAGKPVTGSEKTMAEMTTLRAYLDELDRLLDQEAPTEVISHCRHILQNFPHNVETYRMLGKALLLKAHQEDAIELFEEAAEVFRRVLSALPNDYVAHLGLSEISDRKEDLNRAIWHLERAYEQMPGNAALQDALRELYVKRDGADRAPSRIQLTRGALARQYMQGQLYEQAIAELRAALIQQPERLDLQTLLAEALWAARHEVEAGEVAIELLKRLPNNLAANRIMAQLWLENERPTDARPFLDRVEALDPYLAARVLKPDGDLPDEIELPRLDYYHQSQAMLSAETPGWVQELGTPGQDISMEDLFTVPGQQTPSRVVDRETPAESSQLDMAALFGEVPVPDVSNLWTSDSLTPDSDQYYPPSSETPDDFPVPDVSWFAEETDEAAIEADWVLDTDEHGESEPPPAESSGAPASPSLAEAGLWEELQTLDDSLSAAPSLEQLTSEEDTVSPPSMETLDWLQERPPSPESAPADFLDQLGETPDFAELGTEEIDWSVFESLAEEANTQATESAAVPSQPPSPSGDLPPEKASASPQSETQLPWEETAERVLDAALDHPDEQHLHAEIDAAFEEILAAEELIEEAGEAISTPEWLPSPEELVGQVTSETPRDIPSLGELAAAMDEKLPTEPEEETEGLAALDESLQWLDASLDTPDTDLLAALAAAGQAETSPGAEALAEPAPEIPDWLREAAPLPERATTEEIAQPDSAMVRPAEEPSLTSEAAAPSWVEREPAPQTEWETLEDAQSLAPDQPVESTADEAELSHVEAQEDWLRIFAQQDEEPLPESQQEEASAEEASGAMSGTDNLSLPQGEFTDEQTIDEYKQGEEPLPATESWKPDLEEIEGEISISAEPGWLADWPAPEAPSSPPDEELAALLSEPYDPFEGGSPENVPRYQAASETGILQPDEQPDWMTAFLGGELPETDRLPESAQEQAATRPLAEEESLPEAEWPEETLLSSEEIAPTDEWTVEQPAPTTEDAVPDWLMAIADSEADKLAELFSSDEFFTPQEEEFAGIQEPSLLEEPGKEELAMPETHEAFFAPTAEETPDVATAAQALPDDIADFVPESEAETSLPSTDEYADEPVPEDFSFGDWVPIWLRAPLEGQPEDLLNQNRDIPPAPPEWLRDVAEEDE